MSTLPHITTLRLALGLAAAVVTPAAFAQLSVSPNSAGSGFQSAVGSNYSINNSGNPDLITWGTAATTFGKNILSLDRVSSNFVLPTNGTATKVGALTYTNTHTTGGLITAVDYNLKLNLPDFATAINFTFTLTINTTSDPSGYAYSPMNPDSIKWTSSNETQVLNLGGLNYVFAFSFADKSGSFLETENQFYAVDESYTKKTLIRTAGCDDDYSYTSVWGTDCADILVSVVKPVGVPSSGVPEPSTFGLLGACALLAFLTVSRASKK